MKWALQPPDIPSAGNMQYAIRSGGPALLWLPAGFSSCVGDTDTTAKPSLQLIRQTAEHKPPSTMHSNAAAI